MPLMKMKLLATFAHFINVEVTYYRITEIVITATLNLLMQITAIAKEQSQQKTYNEKNVATTFIYSFILLLKSEYVNLI